MHIKIMAFFLMLLPCASYAVDDMFLDITDVTGESKDEAHRNEIDLIAWSWGASTSGRMTCIQDLGVTKWVDSSSPTLLMGQVEDRVYDEATLTVRKDGDNNPLEYIIIKFKNVTVSSISMGSPGGEDRLTEKVSLNFESATYEYTPQQDTGAPGTTVIAEIYPNSRCK